MTTELEQHIRELRHGDHCSLIYESADEQMAAIVPFMIEGLARSECCICIADGLWAEEVVAALEAAGVNAPRERERGALLLLTERDAYLRSGAFDPLAMIDFLRQLMTQALAAGFSGLRVTSEMTWTLGSESGRSRLNESEALLDYFYSHNPVLALCQYHRSDFPPEGIQQILLTHPVVILGDQVCPNPHYELPQMILGQISASEQVDWKIDQLKRAHAAQQTIRERNALLNAVVEGTTDAIFVKDRQGRYLMINPAGARFLGKPVDEVLGKDDTELFTPETACPIIEADRKILETEDSETYKRAGTAAGVRRTYVGTKGPYRDREGNVAGIIGIAHDITESETLQAERDRLLARLRLQIERLPLAYILLDTAGRVSDWNPAAEKLFGYTREEASGRVGLDLIGPSPIDEHLQEIFRRIWAGDMNAHGINENRTRDGRIITCEWFNTPLIEADGSFGGVISLAQDITERRRASAALEESQRRFQAVFENSLDSILLMDDTGRFADANPAVCHLLGYNREELLQLTVWDITPVQDRERIPERLSRFLSSGAQSGEYMMLCKGGATREVEYRTAANILPGLHMASHRNITDRKRTEATLRENAERLQVLSRRVVEVQEEERRRIARELHDEIGQVLGAIGLNFHAAKGVSDADAWPRLDECLGIVDRAVEQVRNLALDLRPSMLDDLGLAAASRWLAERQAERAGLVAHFVVQSSGTHLPPDLATACYRVAQEALTNVVRHARARQVWVELEQGEEEIRLAIRDDGVGFDPGEARRRAARGESLGLLGLQERVELLGGRVAIESEPGQGTTIRVQFPGEPARITEQQDREASDDEADPGLAGRRP